MTRILALIACLIPGLTGGPAMARATLIHDFRQGNASIPSDLSAANNFGLFRPKRWFAEVSDFVLFNAEDASHGWELWRSDGTPAGTFMLLDIRPGRRSSSPSNFTMVDGGLFFVANDGAGFRELWFSDGSAAGTKRLDLINLADEYYGSAQRIFPLKHGVAFTAGHSLQQIWFSDGTEAGTRKVLAINGLDHFEIIGVLNNSVVFSARNQALARSLWIGDNSGSSARLLFAADEADIYGYFGAAGHEVNGRFFYSNSAELWLTDGTAEGTLPADSIYPLLKDQPRMFLDRLSVLGNKLIAIFSSEATGDLELWSIDTRSTNAQRLLSVPPAEQGSVDLEFAGQGDDFLLVKKPYGPQPQIFTSDGTPDGTFPLTVVHDSAFSLSQARRVVFQGAAPDAVDEHGQPMAVIWESDGTDSGTRRISPTFKPNRDDQSLPIAYPGTLIPLGQQILFRLPGVENHRRVHSELLLLGSSPGVASHIGSTYLPDTSSEPMVNFAGDDYYVTLSRDETSDSIATRSWLSGSDGFKDFAPILYVSIPHSNRPVLPLADGRLVFTPYTAPHGGQSSVWVSDGTLSGSHAILSGEDLVSPLFPFAGNYVFIQNRNNYPDPPQLAVFSISREAGNVQELLVESEDTDRIRCNGGDCFSGKPVLLNGRLLLAADAFNGKLLFALDLDDSRLKFLTETDGRLADKPMVKLDNRAYFVKQDNQHGVELWRTNGTVDGTELALDILPGPESSSPSALSVVDGYLHFFANEVENGIIRRKRLAFDGKRLMDSADVFYAGPRDICFTPAATRNGLRFVDLFDPDTGREPWVVNCTRRSKSLLLDLFPGAQGSNPELMQIVGDLVFFTAATPELGNELFFSDGSPEGTGPVDDIAPGPAPSNPGISSLGSGFKVFGEQLLFAANDGVRGVELWGAPATGMRIEPKMLWGSRQHAGFAAIKLVLTRSATMPIDAQLRIVIHSADGNELDRQTVPVTFAAGQTSLRILRSLPPVSPGQRMDLNLLAVDNSKAFAFKANRSVSCVKSRSIGIPAGLAVCDLRP